MAYKIVKNIVPSSKYSIKGPHSMTPAGVVIHNTANDASARNEIAYMTRNNMHTSFHYAIDDKEAVQGIPLNRNSWQAGDGSNGRGNRKMIAIEICYSKSGGSKFIAAEKNAAKLAAKLLQQRGFGIGQLSKHQDYSGKYCPHRTLDMGWGRFQNMVAAELKALNKPAPTPKPKPKPTPKPPAKAKSTYTAYKDTKRFIVNKDTNLWNLDSPTWGGFKSVKKLKKGERFDAVGLAFHPLGSTYAMTAYSFGNADKTGKPRHNTGVNIKDLDKVEPPKPPAPKPPKPPEPPQQTLAQLFAKDYDVQPVKTPKPLYAQFDNVPMINVQTEEFIARFALNHQFLDVNNTILGGKFYILDYRLNKQEPIGFDVDDLGTERVSPQQPEQPDNQAQVDKNTEDIGALKATVGGLVQLVQSIAKSIADFLTNNKG